MRARLSPARSFALYGIVLGFVFLFYVLGLLIGKNYLMDAKAISNSIPIADHPLPDVKSQLDFYQQVLTPTEGEESPQEAPGSLEAGQNVYSEAASPASPEPSASGEIYTIQVGAFRTEVETSRILIRLEAQGYPNQLRRPKPPEDPYYRVWVGRFARHEEARQMQSRLQEDGFHTFIKKIGPSPPTN